MRAPERRPCPGGAPAGPSGPRRNDLDEAEHRPIVEGGRGAGISGCQGLLIGDRRHHLAGRMPAPGVVVLDPGRHLGPGLRPGGEVLHLPEFELQRGVLALLPRDAPVPVLAATPGTHLPDPPDSPAANRRPNARTLLIPAAPGLLRTAFCPSVQSNPGIALARAANRSDATEAAASLQIRRVRPRMPSPVPRPDKPVPRSTQDRT